ncbi:chemotaxis protein CheA [Magnetospirillum molischianum]|uniref:Chemotaxis protein CheA n=1 Tax=Magnetospirillum molischianum DSM 120 TaxID=1150626 RepID=H8FVG1_MAGML|nr:chemotaxis protein CheA [Magnetospirillum molischianum]CCG42349.1 Putative CheA Signal Transduction Histidine Kinases (STHK) [Magnetospirillum molischianum DSM 120]
MTPLLARFLPEARDLIQVAATGLLNLEKNPSDETIINDVFRSVHTLKGSSGLFEVAALTQLVHAAEDLLGAVRAGQIALISDMVDMLLDALDQVSLWIDSLERTERLPDDAEATSRPLVTRLRGCCPQSASKAKATTATAEDGAADWLGLLPESDRLAAFAHAVSGHPLLALHYCPDESCFFSGEDPLNLVRQCPEMLTGFIVPRAQWEPLDSFEPYQCRLDFLILSSAPRAEIEHLFRYVTEQVRIAAVAPEHLILLEGNSTDCTVCADFVAAARTDLDAKDFNALRRAVDTELERIDSTLRAASALRWLNAVLGSPLPNPLWIGAMVEAIASGKPPCFDRATTEPKLNTPPPSPAMSPLFHRILGEQRRVLSLPAEPDQIRTRIASVVASITNLLVSAGLADLTETLTRASSHAFEYGSPTRLLDLLEEWERCGPTSIPAGKQPPSIAPASPGGSVASPEDAASERTTVRMLKVDQAKIDLLMNLIGELVVSKNSLPFLAKRAEQVHGSREMAREIKDQYAVIDRLAQEMQGAIMQVRMLPVSEVFERFPRLVRDLSRKLGKTISLEIEGEETAADKSIIESLADPLIHIVRNALDHGIEYPDERRASGKSSHAAIRLKAFQEADQVVIEVGDDGRGIDPAAIKAAAIAKEVITQDQADLLSDQDAINLIFHPGFSTAEQISDLSGRGVGMDVVHNTIERLNGTVQVSSILGEGTVVRLSLPLSMAVTRVMMVETGSQLFGIPMDMIVETVRVPVTAIRTIKRTETFVLRDTLIPLVRMTRLLNLPGRHRDEATNEDEAVLVCRVNGSPVGLVIDSFREGMDVILKPLDGLLANIPGYSGTALLGDGRVLLVLNLKELL